MANSFNPEENQSFRQIVLAHLKQILNLSLRSNQDGQKLGLYINSIDSLSDVLIPFYDEQMSKEYREFEDDLLALNKKYAEVSERVSPFDMETKYIFIHDKKKKILYRNLFRKLNLLLKRNDYLKESVYGEDTDESEIVEDNSEASQGEEE